MSMKEWAEREIELLKEANKPDEGECFDYVGGCCDSALKAFEMLLDDEHSGLSIQITKMILDKLIDGKALTPIEDVPESWNYVGCYDEEEEAAGIRRYQCKRMSSLFKVEYPDGTVVYNDVDRDCGVNLNNPDVVFGSGTVSRIINEMFPITMPYTPPAKPYKVYTEDFLSNKDNRDFDTEGFFYVETPDGEKIEINKFYHYPARGEKIEITREKYEAMKANRADKPIAED